MPNRYICTVLEEMRQCYKTRNFSYLEGLIEEAQSLGDRMESALEDKNYIILNRKVLSKLKKEIKELEEKRDELKGEM